MPTPCPKHPPPTQPTRVFFDPFNSSSTGHQRAENRLSGSTSWRDSRTHKLAHQFKDTSGRGGNQHLLDLVGAGSENFGKDGRKDSGDWEVSTLRLREDGWQDIRDLMSGNRKRSSDAVEDNDSDVKRHKSTVGEAARRDMEETAKSKPDEPRRSPDKQATRLDTSTLPSTRELPPEQPPQIFRNLAMYLNGSTAPLISDHKLKHIFTQHGGNTSIALGRRTVTHVILGNGLEGGGGLASGKIQKEVNLVRGLGKGVKYVTARWVIDSVDEGIRQPESRYVPKGVKGRLGGSGQASIRGMLMPKTK